LDVLQECWDATVAAPSFSKTSWDWNLWAAETMAFSAMTSDKTTAKCGTITYAIITTNLPSTDVYTLSGTSVVGTPSDKTTWVGTFTFKVTGQ